ncbi:Na+/H+ antiporter NhaA [bacterium]|nr:Na+/H+ antiporter NhaA [bacterium]
MNVDKEIKRAFRPLEPFREFFETESLGGLFLLIATIVALILANSEWSGAYEHARHLDLRLGAGDGAASMSLLHLINDGLMAVFFFVVGLEIKRELLIGELSSPRKAMLPAVAAAGGMLAPALIFVAFNTGEPTIRGWGVPTATDIAFALGVTALLKNRVPDALRVFLVALAIVDDLGAILIIAIFYSESLSMPALAAAAGVFALMVIANRMRVRPMAVFAFLGALLWLAFLQSGIHATIAGVAAAMTIPARPRLGIEECHERVRGILERLGRLATEPASKQRRQREADEIHALESVGHQANSPLATIEHRLNPVVMFAIMPLFALANAGVELSSRAMASLGDPVALGIFFGLWIGKPAGILLLSWMAVKARVADLPGGANWRQMAGAGCLAGIGFTMSLFIAALAFGESAELGVAKFAILLASLAAGITGTILLLKRNPGDADA